MAEIDKPHVLIIDKQPYWRSLSTRALEEKGFQVTGLDDYDYPPRVSEANLTGSVDHFDLVILGCTQVRGEELRLIKRILDYKERVVVLSSSLPWAAMRSVFLAGANDAANKPYDSQRLLEIIEDVVRASRPRDSYEQVELAQEGI